MKTRMMIPKYIKPYITHPKLTIVLQANISNTWVDITPNRINTLPAKTNPTTPSMMYNPQSKTLANMSAENLFKVTYIYESWV